MSSDELVGIIDSVIQAIDLNREAAKPDLIAFIENSLGNINPAFLEAAETLFGVSQFRSAEVIQLLKKLIEFENHIVTDNVDQSVRGSLVKLKGRPLVLKMIAAAL